MSDPTPTRGRDPMAHPADPGAYIGDEPEREADTIPGGSRPGAERIAAYGSEAGKLPPGIDPTEPEGHRDGPPADDDTRREAGESR